MYEALREGASEPVALKVLTGLSAGDRARAEREAAIAASLDHPAITRLVEHGAHRRAARRDVSGRPGPRAGHRVGEA